MPRGDKSKYTEKQKRQAEHIEDGYRDRGVPADEAEARAWATVNKMTGGGKKSGAGRGKEIDKEPARKGGSSDERRFSAVEEMASAVMCFPDDRLASFSCSLGAARGSAYEVVGSRGALRVAPAYGYAEDLALHLTVDEKSRQRVFPQRDPFAPQLIYFSDCIRNDRKPEPSGREGLIDVRIIEALSVGKDGACGQLSAHKKAQPAGDQAGTQPSCNRQAAACPRHPPGAKRQAAATPSQPAAFNDVSALAYSGSPSKPTFFSVQPDIRAARRSLHCSHAGCVEQKRAGAFPRYVPAVLQESSHLLPQPKERFMKLHTALFFALSLAAMSPAYAADDMKDAMEGRAEARYDAAKDTAKQDYKRAKEDCERLPGNAKDVCMKEAEAAYVKAKSGAKADKRAAEGQAEATDDQMKASYEVEKEKCEQLSGSTKDACIDNAKMKYRQ